VYTFFGTSCIYVCVLEGLSLIIKLFSVLHISSTYKSIQTFKIRHRKKTLCRKNFDLLMVVNSVTTGLRNVKMVKKVLASGKSKCSCFSKKADFGWCYHEVLVNSLHRRMYFNNIIPNMSYYCQMGPCGFSLKISEFPHAGYMFGLSHYLSFK